MRFPGFTNEWKEIRLKEVAEFQSGYAFKSDFFSQEGIKLVIPKNFTKNGYGNFDNNISKFSDEIPSLNYKCVENDLLVLLTDLTPTCELLGKPLLVKNEDGEIWLNQRIVRLDLKNSVSKQWLLYFLQTESYHKVIKENATGSTVRHSSNKIIGNIILHFPNLKEQKKIDGFLALLDTRIQTQNKIIKDLNVLKTTITKRIFSRQLRFKDQDGNDFPEWKNMKLGDIGEVKMCRRIFNDETSLTGEIPFFKIGSFGKVADAFISQELYLDYRNRFSFPKKGDILISAAGTIGRTVVYKGEDAYYQDSNIVWIDNNNTIVINEFLYYILQIVKYNTEGGTIQRLYNNILKSTKFDCPTLPEQQKITNFLSSIDSKIDIENKLLQKLEEQKKFLLHQMFV